MRVPPTIDLKEMEQNIRNWCDDVCPDIKIEYIHRGFAGQSGIK